MWRCQPFSTPTACSRCCEFTGVPLKVLLDECGADLKKGKFLLAEGGDGSGMTRTINLESCLDDTIVAWAMNGEMLRPEKWLPIASCCSWCSGCKLG
jgi:sulfane dehydrogenase subunit SoxC